jgi:hypothetical protein
VKSMTVVIAGRVWAWGGLRAEVQKESERRWRWRVWQVVGGETLERGSVPGIQNAARKAKERLEFHAAAQGYA